MNADEVVASINPQEVVDLALALGNIESGTGMEGEAGQYVYDWLEANGFQPKKYALIENRFNVAAWLRGSGGGYSLVFNSHLDTSMRRDSIWSARDANEKVWHTAWIDGDNICGDGVVNDKGPMAAFLVAGKAIRDAGYPLKGDVALTAVAGEISREPIDEFQGPQYLSKDLGARFMATHGVVGDFVLVAEGTGFGIVGIEAGKAQFRVNVYTDTPRYYDAYLPRPTTMTTAANAIVRAAAVITAFEDWAYEYRVQNTYEGPWGRVVPNASVNAIRSGYPYNNTSTPQICALYVNTRILPGASPIDLKIELENLLKQVGVEGDVELTQYRPGFEVRGAEPLIEAVKRCHAQTFPTPPAIVADATTSMWRDTNAFNELGIPAISYAPRSASHASQKCFKIADLVDASRVYARIAMDLCNQDRPAKLPLGAHINRDIAATVADRLVKA
jgi:acetylornithine deacetylase/succinyl-diaminopimelate desuccinylase-like protein